MRMKWMATCFNWNRCDTFIAFGETREEAVNKIINAYKKWYNMTEKDLEEEYDYDSFLDYLTIEKELTAYETISDGVYINNEVRYKEG